MSQISFASYIQCKVQYNPGQHHIRYFPTVFEVEALSFVNEKCSILNYCFILLLTAMQVILRCHFAPHKKKVPSSADSSDFIVISNMYLDGASYDIEKDCLTVQR